MQTYKELVKSFRAKNSKTPKTTWRYESWGDSYEPDPRSGYQDGQLVDHGPGRQGYAAPTKQGVQPGPGRAGKGIYNPSLSERGQKIIKAIKEYNNLVLKDFNKGNLTNTETFTQFAGKKYGHQLVKSQSDMALKYPEVEGFKIKRLDATRDKLFKKLINEANQGEQFVDFPSIAKKISKTAPVVHTSAAYRKLLDTKSDKVKKVFNNIAKNDEPLHLVGKGHGPLWDANPLLKIIGQRSGVKSAPIMREALDTDPFYKKNKKLIKFAGDARLMDYGKPLSEILEQADYRIGGGVQWSYGTGKRPAKDVAETVNDFALKHWNQHKRNKTGNSQIEFFSKKNNKPISWEKVSKSPRTGVKSLISTDVYFKYKNDPKQRKWSLGELRKSGREAGIFDEVYKTRYSYHNMMNKMVTNPVNSTGKKIRFGQLMSKVLKEGFDDASNPYAIDHIKGVAKSPFNDLRLASTRTNLALSYINKYVPQKNFKKTLISELMGGATDFKSKQYVNDLVKQGEGLAKEVLVGGKKVPISSVQEVGGKFLKPSKFETLTNPQKKITQRMAKADTYKVFKTLQDANIPCIKGDGGNCTSPEDFRKGFNELVQKGAAGDKAAVHKLKKFTNLMKIAKGPLKWTAYGLLGEIGFMVPFGVADYTKGESWKRIIGNASDWGFGPMFGQSEDEEIIANLPKDSLGGAIPSALEAGERVKRLEDPNRVFPKGRLGMYENRFQKAQAKVIPDAALDYRNKLAPFMEGPRNEYSNQEKVAKAFKDREAAKVQIEKDKLATIEERRDRGFIAEEGWEKNVRRVNRMEGGKVEYDNSLPDIFEEDK